MAALTALYILLPLLMIDAVLELSFISSMVGFLHARAGSSFQVSYTDTAGQVHAFALHGKPKFPEVNQGHTSNGAAGAALVLVGFGGLIALWLHRRQGKVSKVSVSNSHPGQPGPTFPSLLGGGGDGKRLFVYDRVAAPYSPHEQASSGLSRLHSIIFPAWVVLTVLSCLLTLSALIYTFLVTHQTAHQSINAAVAAANPEPAMYPLDEWTPENWFRALLRTFHFALASDRAKIHQELRLMRGWRWNLIPLFILGLFTAIAAVAEWSSSLARPRHARHARHEPAPTKEEAVIAKSGSPVSV